MPTTQRQSITGALATALLKQTALANSVVKLFKEGFLPSVTSPVADFDTNECDFDDYAPVTIVAWGDPSLASVPGYQLNGGLVSWACAADQVTGNMVGGLWIENAAGALLDFVIFDPPIPMQYAAQVVEWVPIEFFPAA